jgi:carbamoyl-phosphate synthase small subunit
MSHFREIVFFIRGESLSLRRRANSAPKPYEISNESLLRSMNDSLFTPAVLLLEDGTVFHGKAAGKIGSANGEICFNTGMTGYQEIFTDPSYYGQLLVTTNVHIGNYGAKNKETESDSVKIAGLICKNFTIPYSRQKADESIQDYFEREGLVGISQVDTRAIVRHIRYQGAMNAIISSETLNLGELKKRLAATPSMKGLELASAVSVEEPYHFGDPAAAYRVAVFDYGVKRNILENLSARNCYLKVFPAKTSLDEVKAWNPHGYFLSNGPGDPAAMDYAVHTVKAILAEDQPLFGICLGHQLLALAVDIPTYKMHHGHRGINHPVKNLLSGQCEITSQNHGFGVSHEAIQAAADRVEVTHVNLNDQTVEGIRLRHKKAFSVQYHPEASPGPHDARYLFDHFIELMRQTHL